MGINVFKQDKNFWAYHSFALVLSFSIELISTLTWSSWVPYTIAGDILWLPLYTIIVFIFQWLDDKYKLHLMPMKKLATVVIIYSIAAAILAAILNQAIVLPLFWTIIYNGYIQPNHLNSIKLISALILGRILLFQLFICAWIFVYISITTNKREKETALTNILLQNSLKEAQLNSLSNQLNPHFLFNALNNIRFMIHENTQNADNMITSLSEMLRYSLESNKQEKVLLGQEIEVINRYIAIAQAQLGSRLNFNMNISQKLSLYLVPPMAVQMLVENAIKHGLDNIKNGGVLILEVLEKNDQLIFTVINDIPLRINFPQKSPGIGLSNIKQRLHLLYGNKAILDITKTTSEFKVIMTLPKEFAE